MRKLATAPLALDAEVASLVQRIGSADPLTYMTDYTVTRNVGGLAKVTITFLADDEFSKVTTREETANV